MAMNDTEPREQQPADGGLSVLVVEDEMDDARFALEALEASGLKLSVEATPYGERALELLDEPGFDCVLLDYRLPRMDGVEFLERLREGGSDLPVVVLTGRGSEEVAQRVLDAGANAYLSKDETDPGSVRRKIEDALGRS